MKVIALSLHRPLMPAVARTVHVQQVATNICIWLRPSLQIRSLTHTMLRAVLEKEMNIDVIINAR